MREKLGSRIGFILLAAGSAIGCGNVWKFPWLTGENGGGIFVVIYVILSLLIGLPAMCMEIALGRAAQTSPVKMYQKLGKSRWQWQGYMCLIANICVAAFYSVVCGWIFYYFISFLVGDIDGLSFSGMISDPKLNVVYLVITTIATFFILSFDLKGGLERVSKILMVALFLLMIVLTVRCSFFSKAIDGVKYFLVPDFSEFTLQTISAAANQAFFSLSLGFGIMAIFGSYIDKSRSLLGEALNIVILDTLAAILAGLIIFPVCFEHGVDVGSGPGLLFDTMAEAFRNMAGGRVIGCLFFLFMTFAALTSILSICETILGSVRELTGWNRKTGSLVCGIGVTLFSLTTALGFSVLNFHPFGQGTSWMDLWNFSVTNLMFPLGALVVSLFCTNSRFGWGWESFSDEANQGEGIKVQKWMRPIFAYFAPFCIFVLLIIGLVTFKYS